MSYGDVAALDDPFDEEAAVVEARVDHTLPLGQVPAQTATT
jgi:hypothetical protein